jgi:hypothetical protein
MIATASLRNSTACVTQGAKECVDLIEFILRTGHKNWEVTLFVGDFEFHQGSEGRRRFP